MYDLFVELLQKNNMRAADVARATGLASSLFSEWKKGKSQPKIDKLQKIADFFGVPLSYFTGENEIMNNIKPLQTSSKFYYDLARIADKHGITINQLCEQVTGGQSELDLWKRGYISAEHLIEISRLWNCSTDYLLRIEEVNLSKTDEMSTQLLEKYKTLTFDQKISVMNYVINLAKENNGKK